MPEQNGYTVLDLDADIDWLLERAMWKRATAFRRWYLCQSYSLWAQFQAQCSESCRKMPSTFSGISLLV
ncbi:MAG: hypothetical protein ACLS6W_08580 [Ruminococcus sp.]